MGLLDGKIALVTGGTRGIGKGICEKFVQEGATVVFTYLSSEEKADALALELSARSATVGTPAISWPSANVSGEFDRS